MARARLHPAPLSPPPRPRLSPWVVRARRHRAPPSPPPRSRLSRRAARARRHRAGSSCGRIPLRRLHLAQVSTESLWVLYSPRVRVVRSICLMCTLKEATNLEHVARLGHQGPNRVLPAGLTCFEANSTTLIVEQSCNVSSQPDCQLHHLLVCGECRYSGAFQKRPALRPGPSRKATVAWKSSCMKALPCSPSKALTFHSRTSLPATCAGPQSSPSNAHKAASELQRILHIQTGCD